jgi:hypothetical protein
VISYGAAMPKLSGMTATDDSHFARTFPSDKIVLKGLVDFVQHRKWKGVTFLTTANEFGYDGAREWQSSIEELQERMSASGDPTVLYSQVVLVNPDDPEDIRNQLQLIKNGDWRVVICHAVENEATRIIHEAVQHPAPYSFTFGFSYTLLDCVTDANAIIRVLRRICA